MMAGREMPEPLQDQATARQRPENSPASARSCLLLWCGFADIGRVLFVGRAVADDGAHRILFFDRWSSSSMLRANVRLTLRVRAIQFSSFDDQPAKSLLPPSLRCFRNKPLYWRTSITSR